MNQLNQNEINAISGASQMLGCSSQVSTSAYSGLGGMWGAVAGVSAVSGFALGAIAGGMMSAYNYYCSID